MNKTIVICSPGNSFPGKFLVSLTHLIKHLSNKGFTVKFCTTYEGETKDTLVLQILPFV